MKPFDYTKAVQPAEAVRLLGETPQSRFVAGGTNLVDLMKYYVETPSKVVDILHLPLTKIEPVATGIRIGALARNSEVADDPLIKKQFPLLSEALLAGASAQLRNMATMGGNLMQRTRCYYFYDASQPCNKRRSDHSAGLSGCGAIGGYNRIHAILGTGSPDDPASKTACIATNPSDMNVALSALDATIRVVGPKGERTIPILDFHRLPGDRPDLDTTLGPDELITAIDLPTASSAGMSHYLKVRDRASYAFALVSVAARLVISNGTIRDARIALGGVAHKPWRLPEVERQLVGKPAGEPAFREAAKQLIAGAKPYEHNAFKIQLAESAIVRALETVAKMS